VLADVDDIAGCTRGVFRRAVWAEFEQAVFGMRIMVPACGLINPATIIIKLRAGRCMRSPPMPKVP
jgi:hypothetical protein